MLLFSKLPEEDGSWWCVGLLYLCAILAAILCCRGVGGEAIIWQVSGGTPEY